MQPAAAAIQGEPGVEAGPEPREERHARRASAVSVPLLALIAVSFFLPSLQICGPPSESVADQVSGYEEGKAWWVNIFGRVWLISPFLIAAVLLSVTAATLLLRTRPGKWSILVAAGGLLVCLLSVIYFPAATIASLFGPYPIPITVSIGGFWVGSFLSATAAFLLFFRGSRWQGWNRWGHFLGAYTLLIAPHSFWFWDALDECNVLYGGCIYLGAVLGLLLTSGWAIVPTLFSRPAKSSVSGEVHLQPSPPP